VGPSNPSWHFLRACARWTTSQKTVLTVTGLEHIPARGPVLIAARHYHHLYDGSALFATIDRPLHVIVGLDWVGKGPLSYVMKRLCTSARWPVVMRASGDEIGRVRVFRKALRETTELLREGRVVIVFPEGYPNIDPHSTPKRGEEFLPFQAGFLKFARVAESAGVGPVPIVATGFSYRKLDAGDSSTGKREWAIHLAFGEPFFLRDMADERSGCIAIEAAVRRLSDAAR
jgi:1-acyl-sn-glycerol-3-phosphate acyltransferase